MSFQKIKSISENQFSKDSKNRFHVFTVMFFLADLGRVLKNFEQSLPIK